MKRPISLILFIMILFGQLKAQGLKFSTKAESAILFNPDTGVVLFEKNPHKPHHPASILKIATALFVLDQKGIDPNTQCIVSKEAVQIMNANLKQANFGAYPPYILEHDAVLTGLKCGKSYSFDTLFHGMLLASGNDAANAVAEASSGSIDKFVEELNAYLKAKGISNTHLVNPHGLHHPDQVTTAFDMAQITALGFKNPTFAKIIRSTSFEGDIAIENTNRLLKQGKYLYPKFLGGKTGYVASAGYNLVAAAEDKGRRLIAVLLGCQTNEARFKDAIALFETAFREEKKERILFSKEHECFVQKIPKAQGLLKGHLNQDVVISYYPSEEQDLKAKVLWNPLKLPIAAGTQVGKLVVEDQKGNSLVEAPLFSQVRLKKAYFYRLVDLAKWIGLFVLILGGVAGALKFLKKGAKVGQG